MTVDVSYEAVEYGKVLLGYVLLMLVGPSVIFYRHLRHKPLTYRFGFCIAVVPVCLNALVLVLGLLHILSMPLTAAILIGIFGLSAARLIWEHRRAFAAWKHPHRIPAALRGRDAVCGVLWAVTLVFGTVYFTYGAFQVSCYGFGDLYVHHSWIYGLMQGEVYSDGIYPEAMHCFVYCLRALFGISVFSGLRFLQCVHVVVFLASVGCLLREIFRWRYTPVLTLLLFLTLDVRGADLITSMSRLQWSLPMEFGLPYAVMCPLFLLRYIKGAPGMPENEGVRARLRDENLLLFLLAMTATLSIHYYTAIMAFLLCVPVVLCTVRRIFRPERLIPLAAAVLCGLLIAAAPMAWALAGGKPFQGSINWALSTMDGESAREAQERLDTEGENGSGTDAEPSQKAGRGGVYRNGYAKLYGEGRGTLLLALCCAALTLCLAGKIRRAKWAEGAGCGYVPLILMSAVFVVTYAMPYMGLPQIVAEGRFAAIGHPLTLASALVPLDIAAGFAGERWGEKTLRKAAVLASAGICAAVRLTGVYHGFLYYELSRYPGAVNLTRTIMERFEPQTYGIVSPTDELYQMIEKGQHIELLSFQADVEQEEYYLWLDDIFFFVEKQPLYYAQLYFAQGPSWLGEEKYPEASREEYRILHPTWRVSQAPYVIASDISHDKVERELTEKNAWLLYTRLENREVLESRAYEQCMRLMEAYPDQMEIYYEDEDLICFRLHQDLSSPCNLAMARAEAGPALV